MLTYSFLERAVKDSKFGLVLALSLILLFAPLFIKKVVFDEANTIVHDKRSLKLSDSFYILFGFMRS